MKDEVVFEIAHNETGAAGVLGQQLERLGYHINNADDAAPSSKAEARRLIRLFDIGAASTIVRPLHRAGEHGPVVTAAVADESDEAALNRALALGFDVLLPHQATDEDLEFRLRPVHLLSRFGRDMPVSCEGGGRQAKDRLLPAPRPHALLIGPPSAIKVRVRHALGTFRVDYTEARNDVAETGTFDIVIHVSADAREMVALGHREAQRANSALIVLNILKARAPATKNGADEGQVVEPRIPRATGFDDVIIAPLHSELLNARLLVWRRIAERRVRDRLALEAALTAQRSWSHECGTGIHPAVLHPNATDRMSAKIGDCSNHASLVSPCETNRLRHLRNVPPFAAPSSVSDVLSWPPQAGSEPRLARL